MMTELNDRTIRNQQKTNEYKVALTVCEDTLRWNLCSELNMAAYNHEIPTSMSMDDNE